MAAEEFDKIKEYFKAKFKDDYHLIVLNDTNQKSFCKVMHDEKTVITTIW